MKKIDIRALVAEYGAPNLRIFITRDRQGGFFKDPFDGRKEYTINETRDPLEKNYKIALELTGVDRVQFPDGTEFAPDWWITSFNQYRMYICDFNNSENIEVFVLVDDDNKYQQVA